MSEGTKFDAGKPPLDLLDRLALEEAAFVMAHGERKYSAYNWRKGLTQRKTIGAALRHLEQHLDGEDIDSESGRLHLGHAICEIMFAIRMLKDRPDLDDRYREQEPLPKRQAGFNPFCDKYAAEKILQKHLIFTTDKKED